MRNLIILLSLLPLGGQAQVSVVTSIEPLYQLTKTIMLGVGEPELLIKRRASTHHFAFKPSHFRLLQDADLVIWIDRHFESGFQQLPQILREGIVQLELLRTLGLQQQDGHIWYSPALLERIAQKIQQALSQVDPQHRETYARNTRELTEILSSWRLESEAQIKTAKPRYLLDHDFLRHFENDIGIEAIAVLHDSHGQPASIRALQMVEANLIVQPAVCLLTNEATASKLARNLARKFNLNIYSITEVEPVNDDSPAIIQTLDALRAALVNCR
jgi:zinc transport system substrate-binding protein